MLMDTIRHPTAGVRFVAGGVGAGLAIFGALRLSWTEGHILLPLAQAQGALAVTLFGATTVPVAVTLACSGADALALCAGAIAAYPAAMRARFTGCLGGIALVFALNIVRIGTLGHAAGSPRWFDTLHLYVWPAVLVLAVAAYVLAWMRFADRGRDDADRPGLPRISGRFAALALAFVLLFSAASPLYLDSSIVLAVAAFVAGAAALLLDLAGIGAHASDSVLWTARGGFLVTQECISTPLIPVYLAAVAAYAHGWRRIVLAAAAVPLFVALGVVRLLVVALPDAVASPVFFVHAFYQLLLASTIVVLTALWHHRAGSAIRHAATGLVVAVLFVWWLGPLYTARVLGWTLRPAPMLDDPQGAIVFLPAFQVGLYLALSVVTVVSLGWQTFLAGLALLGVTQAAGLFTLQALATHDGPAPHVSAIRAWAVAAPVLICAAMVSLGRPRR